MMAQLDGVRIKLLRANHHITELNEMLKPLVSAALETIVREYDGDPTKLVYRVGQLPTIDPEASAIVGDALFNMRSALEHLAWQLVILDGGQPCEHTQFPIYDSPNNANRNPREVTIQPQIRSQSIRDLLKQVQPYQEIKHGHSADEHWFSMVQRLNNSDKHRLLLVMIHTIERDNAAWWGLDQGVSAQCMVNMKPLNSGDPVAWFTFNVDAPTDFDPHMSLVVSLDEGPPGHSMRFTDTVEVLRGLLIAIVRDIDWKFRLLFPNEPVMFPGGV